MGMFCVDEIHTRTNSYANIIGGAGTYATLGAGIVLPRSHRKKVSFICDEGHDFSRTMKQEIESWSMGVIFRKNPQRETTKAWNKFVNNEERLFKYLSPKLQIFAADMPAEARAAKVIHLICSPQRCAEFMADLRDKELRPNQKFVWEPVPTECIPEQYADMKSVVTEFDVDVFSPNALEAAASVGLPEPTTKEAVEQLDTEHYGFAPTIVIRCGAMGSYLRTRSIRKWYPAYFETQQHRVIDPSGAGNAFTGGLGEAMALQLDWDSVMAHASVSSSFMIEQIGPPKYDPELDQWNGEAASDRITNYMELLSKST